jgi:hypothetical protein
MGIRDAANKYADTSREDLAKRAARSDAVATRAREGAKELMHAAGEEALTQVTVAGTSIIIGYRGPLKLGPISVPAVVGGLVMVGSLASKKRGGTTARLALAAGRGMIAAEVARVSLDYGKKWATEKKADAAPTTSTSSAPPATSPAPDTVPVTNAKDKGPKGGRVVGREARGRHRQEQGPVRPAHRLPRPSRRSLPRLLHRAAREPRPGAVEPGEEGLRTLEPPPVGGIRVGGAMKPVVLVNGEASGSRSLVRQIYGSGRFDAYIAITTAAITSDQFVTMTLEHSHDQVTWWEVGQTPEQGGPSITVQPDIAPAVKMTIPDLRLLPFVRVNMAVSNEAQITWSAQIVLDADRYVDVREIL